MKAVKKHLHLLSLLYLGTRAGSIEQPMSGGYVFWFSVITTIQKNNSRTLNEKTLAARQVSRSIETARVPKYNRESRCKCLQRRAMVSVHVKGDPHSWRVQTRCLCRLVSPWVLHRIKILAQQIKVWTLLYIFGSRDFLLYRLPSSCNRRIKLLP